MSFETCRDSEPGIRGPSLKPLTIHYRSSKRAMPGQGAVSQHESQALP